MCETAEMPGVLLEAGTNELEVLVFSVGPTRYGVNVAKVREIIGKVKLVHVPVAHPAIAGVFKLREAVIPLLDLQLYFEPGVASEASQRAVILTEFNNIQMGFLVDSVERIYRLNWNDIRPMPMGQQHADAVVTSVCELDGTLVLMLDFEKIVFDIQGDREAFDVSPGKEACPRDTRSLHRVLLAEDSPTIRRAMHASLTEAGFAHVTAASDGAEAWSLLESSLDAKGAPAHTIVVTDIEMPNMDGLHLCKRIKEHPQLQKLPVVVFSSLVSESNLKKCQAVGADAAITKPEMGRLVTLLDDLLTGQSA